MYSMTIELTELELAALDTLRVGLPGLPTRRAALLGIVRAALTGPAAPWTTLHPTIVDDGK